GRHLVADQRHAAAFHRPGRESVDRGDRAGSGLQASGATSASTRPRDEVRTWLLAALLLMAGGVLLAAQGQRQKGTGMVVGVKPSERGIVVSHDAIRGGMPAMIMPFEVRDGARLRGLTPGSIISFTLRTNAQAAYADDLKVIRYESGEQDPLTVRRLRLLRSARAPSRLEL